jgi:hypothetical protein
VNLLHHVSTLALFSALEYNNTDQDHRPRHVSYTSSHSVPYFQSFSNPTNTKADHVTSGGNQGIGFEIVKAIAALPNHQVLLGCRDTHAGEVAASSMGAPANVNPIQLDITDDESVEHAFLAIEQIFGKLDILINNAGTFRLASSYIVQATEVEADDCVDRNRWPRCTI